jgi:hypothetical protein
VRSAFTTFSAPHVQYYSNTLKRYKITTTKIHTIHFHQVKCNEVKWRSHIYNSFCTPCSSIISKRDKIKITTTITHKLVPSGNNCQKKEMRIRIYNISVPMCHIISNHAEQDKNSLYADRNQTSSVLPPRMIKWGCRHLQQFCTPWSILFNRW